MSKGLSVVELQEPEVTEQVEKENATPPASAGLLLRQAREAAGMHVLTLAETLKVPAAKLQALEAEDWKALPDKVFTRSLALGVCKTLHIDAAPVLALLPKADAAQRFTAPGPGINEPFRDKAVRSVHDTPASGHLWKWVGVAVVGAAAAGAWYFASQQEVRDAVVASVQERSQRAMGAPADSPEPAAQPVVPSGVQPALSAASGVVVPEAAPTVGSADAAAASQPAAASVAEAVKPVPTALPAPVTVVSNDSVVSAPIAPVVPATPAAQATPAQTPPVAEAAAAPAAATGTPAVRIEATAPTWIQVRSQGKVVEQKTLNAGEILETQAPKPLSVVVGRADAATVQVNGAAFDLAAVTRVNVARFEVK